MKKLFYLLIITLFLSSISVHAANRFTVTVSGNYLVPSDGNYKDIYGNEALYPEIKARYKIYRNFFIWAGYGFHSDKGTTISTLNMDAESDQHFFSFGAGFQGRLSSPLEYKLEAGAVNFNYKEKAMGEEISGSVLGIRFEGGLAVNIVNPLFAEVSVGYTKASDTIDGLSIKFGGFKTAVGLGVKF